MAYKKKLKKNVLEEYERTKSMLNSLNYSKLKGIGRDWSNNIEVLDNNLLSLSTDEYRDNYLDEYFEALDIELSKIELNSTEYLKKSMFRNFVIFKFYPDEYEFLDYYYDLYDWYMDFYRADNVNKSKNIKLRVLEGGK